MIVISPTGAAQPQSARAEPLAADGRGRLTAEALKRLALSEAADGDVEASVASGRPFELAFGFPQTPGDRDGPVSWSFDESKQRVELRFAARGAAEGDGVTLDRRDAAGRASSPSGPVTHTRHLDAQFLTLPAGFFRDDGVAIFTRRAPAATLSAARIIADGARVVVRGRVTRFPNGGVSRCSLQRRAQATSPAPSGYLLACSVALSVSEVRISTEAGSEESPGS